MTDKPEAASEIAELTKRLGAVSVAICNNWNDLPIAVRDGANAAANAMDTIASLTAQLARCREETVRECAKVCEQLDGDNAKFGYNRAYNLCARAIRALAPTTGDGR